MAKPTPEELSIINTKFAKEVLTEDEVYVFPNRMIDNLATSYYSRIHENLLKTFLQNTRDGIGLLMNHNSRTLPVGRSFDGEMKNDQVEGLDQPVPTLYGKFYMATGINTQQGMSTDDLAKSINAGTVFDSSIGFSAEQWCCSICNYDIRDYHNCMHWPGERYMVDLGNGVKEEQMCYVDVGADGKGAILENSLVYAGASGRATIVDSFSAGENSTRSDTEEKTRSKLSVVTDLKSVPLGANLFQYLSREGAVLMTDTEVRIDIPKTRSDLGMPAPEQAKPTDQTLSATELQSQLTQKIQELAARDQTISAKDQLLSEKETTIGALTTEKSALTAKVAELQPKAEQADKFRADLIAEALAAGVRAQGNLFKSDQFSKFFATLSNDEVKEYRDGFETAFSASFANANKLTADGKLQQKPTEGQPTCRADFATEQEFRDHVGREAQQYAQDNNIAVDKATVLLYNKYTKEAK